MKDDKKKYYDVTKNIKPHKNIIKFLNMNVKPGKAIVTAVAYNGVKTQIELTVEEEDVTTSQDNKDEGKEEEKVESPQTGDINIAFYIGLMIVSLVGIIKSIKRK